jgi:hypothetical protein
LAEQGKITSEVMVKALADQKDAIEREFTLLPMTFTRAMNNIQTALTNLVGQVDNGLGIFGALAESIDFVARNLDKLINVITAGLFVAFARLLTMLGALAAAKLALAANVGVLTAANLALQRSMGLLGGPGGLIITVVSSLYAFKNEIGLVTNELDKAVTALDEFKAGMAATGGFFSALMLIGTTNPFSTLEEQATKYREEVARLTEQQKTYTEEAQRWLGTANSLENAQKRLAYFENLLAIARRRTTQAQQEAATATDTHTAAYLKMIEGAEKVLKKLEQEYIMLGMTNAERREYVALMALEELGMKSGMEVYAKYAKMISEVNKSIDQREKAIELAKEEAAAAKRAAEEYKRLVESLDDRIARLQMENETFWMGNQEKERAIFLRDLENVKIADRNRLLTQYDEVAAIRAVNLARKKAIDDRLKEEEDFAKQMEKINDQIGQSLTDAIMSGGQKAKDLLINLFKTLVLRPILQPIITGVTGAVMGAIGTPAMAGGSAMGQASGLLGAVGSIKAAFDVLSGGFAGVGNAAANLTATMMGADLAVNAALLESGTIGLAGASMEASAMAVSQAAATVGTLATAAAGIAAGLAAGQFISGKFSIGGSSMISTGVGTAIGAAIGTAILPGVGTAIGAFLGGTVGGVVNRMFGMGARTTENAGYLVQLQAMGAEVQQFEDWKRKGGWFRGDQTGRNITEAAQEVNEFFSSAARAIGMSVQAMAQAVGVSTDRIGEFAQDVVISTKGFTEAEFAQQVEGYLMGLETSLVDFLVPAIGEFATAADKTAADVLKRLTSSLMTVNQAFEVLGYSLYEMSLQGGAAASKLVELFGGLEGFTAATSFYYENFYSAQEKVNFQTEQLTKIFGAMNAELPATREAFRALVEMAQAAGNDTAFANLLQLAPAFNALHVAMEQMGQGVEDVTKIVDRSVEILREREQLETRLLQVIGNTAALRARELAGVDESNRSLLESIYSVEDARSNLDRAMATLERSVAAERMAALKTLDANHKALMESLDGQLRSVQATQQVAREAVTTLGSLFGYISGQVESLNQEINGARTASQGMEFIARALTTAQRTGYLPTQEDLSSAVSAARGGLTPENFATSFEMRRAQAQLASRLTLLGRLTEGQLTIAEKQLVSADKSLEALRERIEQAQNLYATEVERTNAYYDSILDEARAQIDAINGVDTSVLKVEDAINNLSTAISSMQSAMVSAQRAVSGVGGGGGGGAAPTTGSGYSLVGNTLYFPGGGSHSVSGSNAAQTLIETYGLMQTPSGLVRTRAMGGFTPPGMTLVGEEGPELVNFRSPGMVYSNAQSRNLMGGETATEIRQLREENRAQSRAMVALQARMTRVIEQWNGDGLPEERMVDA